MLKNKTIVVFCLCIALINALTFKPIRRYFETTYGYPDDYNNNNYHYNGYGGYSRYYGYSPYYNQNGYATNDKYDYGKEDIEVSGETFSQIYKMGEASGRELVVPDEWNDLNWVVLIGRKPSKRKASHMKTKNMLQVKPTYKQKGLVNNPFLPLHKYYSTQENEKPIEPITALHKVAGPPYEDEIPLNVTFTHDNIEQGTHLASASSMEQKREAFVSSERFIPSPLKSDPNSMIPIDSKSHWKDHVPSPSDISSVSTRTSQGRSFVSKEVTKQVKFMDTPTYTFDFVDAKVQSRTPRAKKIDQFSRRSGSSDNEGGFNLFATVGYPRANFKNFAI